VNEVGRMQEGAGPMFDDVTLGARVRVLRKWRKMTQSELAGLAGLSQSFLSRAERGEVMLDRRSHLHGLAWALRVSMSDLTGSPHLGTDPAQTAAHSAVPALRAALTGTMLGDSSVDHARPLEDLRALLFGKLARLRDNAAYDRRGELVAPLLEELCFHHATGDEAARRAALELMVEACNAAGMTLRHLGYCDLAYTAASRAVEAARRLDDPILAGQAAYLRVLTMPKPRGWKRPLEIAQRATGDLASYIASRDAAETYGMLHLTAALSAAAVNRSDLAGEHLAEARAIADRHGERTDAWCTFGPTNVGIWGLAIAMELGDYERAVKSSKAVNVEGLPNLERKAWFFADRARALAHLPRGRDQAVRDLEKAEALAPQRIRNSQPAQETVNYLLGRYWAASPSLQLRGMAYRMGLI
jgi:transcriptional regulator with XRE-family HTH domain